MRKITSTQFTIRFIFLIAFIITGLASAFVEKETPVKEVSSQQVNKPVQETATQKMITALLF